MNLPDVARSERSIRAGSAAALRPPREDLPPLTGLRFIAALSVALAHGTVLTLKFSSDPYGILSWLTNLSGFGMTLFFVLSGFVIHYNYREPVVEGGYRGFFAFMWARFARLYPLFALVVLLEVVVSQSLSRFVANGDESVLSMLHALAYYALFVQSWFYKVVGDTSLIYAVGPNSALTWSISTEWFFYCCYPAIAFCLLGVRSVRACILGLLIVACLWLALSSAIHLHAPGINGWATAKFGPVADIHVSMQDSFFRWLFYFAPYTRIGEFILGCITAELYQVLRRNGPPQPRETQFAPALITVAVLGTLVVFWAHYLTFVPGESGGLIWIVHQAWSALDYALGPFAALLIFCAVRYQTWLSRVLARGWLVALGEASYSIYLIHFLIFWLVANYVVQEMTPDWATIIYSAVRLLFVLGVIFLIALGLHAYVEFPARSWLRSLWGPRAGARRRSLAVSVLMSPLVVAWALAVIAQPATVVGAPLPVQDGIKVTVATYGGSCGANPGNATADMRRNCDGKAQCDYVVDVNRLRDPAPKCAKDFAAEYVCAPDTKPVQKQLPAEAGLGSHVRLACPPETETAASSPTPATPEVAPSAPEPTQGLRIESATYGESCGVKPGNATASLRRACSGKAVCEYVVDVNQLRDPAPKCGKDFSVDYACAPDKTPLHRTLPAEAGLGGRLRLTCPPEAETAAATPAAAPPEAAPSGSEPAQGLRIATATYGASCGVPPGNVTASLRRACSGKAVCDYVVDVEQLRDPAPKCGKDFSIDYTCAPDTAPLHQELPAEAGLGSRLRLTCPPEAEAAASPPAAAAAPEPAPSGPEPTQGLRIESATYGESCGVKPGNATASLRRACNGKGACDYVVDVNQLRDPAPKCGKDFSVDYTCAPDTTPLHQELPAEAGLGSHLNLSCPPQK